MHYTALTSVTGAASHNDASYGSSFLTRGNVTSVTRYADAAGSGGGIPKYFYYDTLGNLRTADLDCCNQKQWNYSSLTQYAYPDSVVRGSGVTQLTTSASYNFTTGTVAISNDENLQPTNYAYDSMDRRTGATLPNSVVVTTAYDDAATTVTRSNSVNSLVQVTTLDGLGKPVQNEVRNGPTTTVSTTQTSYDAAGRPVQRSNPYGPNESQLWTVTQYDALSRVTLVTPPGSAGSYQYSYSGNAVTITDPAQKQRKNFTDALGRLTQVDEPGWGDGTTGHGSATIGYVSQGTDFGSVTITVGATTKTVNYTTTSTASGLATSLASAFNADTASPVNASTVGGVVNFTSKIANASGNYPLAASAKSFVKPQPSFPATASGPALTGAADPSQPTGSPTLTTPMSTTYLYDTLDDLTKVVQAPQQRIYAYDSLSRLLSAATPESGTVSYTYNSFSQVATRTDARGVITTYTYDDLRRLSQASYNVGSTGVPATPTVTFGYGTSSASNNNGRLLSAAAGSSYSETYSYNLMGWITQAAKTIDGAGYTVGYAYDNAGNLAAFTYPSTRVVQQQYDPIGRLTQLLSAGSAPYLTIAPADYTASGQVKHALYGNGVNGNFTYNEQLQVASIRYSNSTQDLLNLAYSYSTQNNGQIASITDNLDATRSTAYVYDAWSRIKQATAGNPATPTWALSWDYDRFGNRRNQNVTGGTGTPVFVTIDQMTNHITDSGYAYDAAGNTTQENLIVASHAYTYDAENRMKTVDGTAATYTYSGGPLRIKKVAGTATTVYVYSGSKVIAEYLNGSLNKEYVYAGSKFLATVAADGATTYQYADHLSTRVEADANGSSNPPYRTYGHFPFGETWYENGTAGKWKFTTYERDDESALDYAVFRGYSSRLGRFMQTDPLAGSIFSPQSLNRYAYVTNDPINLVDTLGLSGQCVKTCMKDKQGNILSCHTECKDDPTPKPPPAELPPPPTIDVELLQAEGSDDCHRFADMVEQIANRVADHQAFMDEMARTFTAANDSSMSEMYRTRRMAARTSFHASGFQLQFQDPDLGNQVRHFVGGLVAGYRLGFPLSLWVMNYRELPNTNHENDADMALNEKSTRMGAWNVVPHTYYPTTGPISTPGYKKLADLIREEICAP